MHDRHFFLQILDLKENMNISPRYANLIMFDIQFDTVNLKHF